MEHDSWSCVLLLSRKMLFRTVLYYQNTFNEAYTKVAFTLTFTILSTRVFARFKMILLFALFALAGREWTESGRQSTTESAVLKEWELWTVRRRDQKS